MTMLPALGPSWMDPAWLLERFGTQFFIIALLIVFIECGLLFPILPGDSLLFAVGLFIAGGNLPVSLPVALVTLFIAAFGGNVAGYEIGRAIGPKLRERDGRIIKRKYFDQTEAFFDKHGNKALVIGKMDRKRFFTWSAIGAVLWVFGLVLAGYFLGAAFPVLGEQIDKAVIVIVFLSVLPMVWEWWKHRQAAKELREDIVDVVKDELTDDDSAAPSRAVEAETRASRRAAQSATRRDRAPFDQTRD
jgi:membrane-associated protein